MGNLQKNMRAIRTIKYEFLISIYREYIGVNIDILMEVHKLFSQIYTHVCIYQFMSCICIINLYEFHERIWQKDEDKKR